MSHKGTVRLVVLFLLMAMGLWPFLEVEAWERAGLGEIKLGVLLPLNDRSQEGRRMVEYYRGVLMACDSIRQTGLSVDVRAWDVGEDSDLDVILSEPKAKDRDIIIGPLYSKQVARLSTFADDNDVIVVIPFSITAPEVERNSHLFQIYQPADDFNKLVVDQYKKEFEGSHTIIVDCNDSTSRKGAFTKALRKGIEEDGGSLSVTNIRTLDETFEKAFKKEKANIVVLNGSRQQDLKLCIARLDNLKANNPEMDITLFGYTEWLMYTTDNLDSYYKYNVYIPSAFYYDPLSARTARFEQKYRWNFHADMMQAWPRLALSGYDHTFFFLKGLKIFGKTFKGESGSVGYAPIQTKLRFEQVGEGGYKNECLVFVHYTPDHKIEKIQF